MEGARLRSDGPVEFLIHDVDQQERVVIRKDLIMPPGGATPKKIPANIKIERGDEDRPTNGALRPYDLHSRRWSVSHLSSPERSFSAGGPEISPRQKKPCRLKNVCTGTASIDTLHKNVAVHGQCEERVCFGSLLAPTATRRPGTCRPKEEVLEHAKKFFDEYFTSTKRFNSPAHDKRWAHVEKEIEERGTYELEEKELIYGSKLAWRNAPRCIGRIQWSKLQLFDARGVTTAKEMFQAICTHIKYATNKGNVRSSITIFPQRTDGKHDFRIWNSQLISYAGFKQEDGTTVGDTMHEEFTEVCLKMGWKPKKQEWQLLPLVLQANGDDPELFELPEELVMRVKITHPKYTIFEELNLEWYVLPAVSSMMLDCGGLEFTGAPFNGWYMVTEIGARNFCDIHRFNILEDVAKGMGLDTSTNITLWKDLALVEINYAVLHSFHKANCTIVDHHTAAETFKKHWENEQRLRGGCPADWIWHVPPMSGSLMWIFHQEMAYYFLKPSYEYQTEAWKTHVWVKDRQPDGSPSPSPRRFRRFKEVAKAVKFTSNLFGKALARRIKATILFATETGHAEDFANYLGNIFSYAFNVQVMKMETYDISDLEHESLILIVTSTFGNGDPPENGERFARALQAFRETGETPNCSNIRGISTSFVRMNSTESSRRSRLVRNASSSASSVEGHIGPMSSIRYSVFALGSSAYPNYCAFGYYVDNLLGDLGGERILPIASGDELCGQEQSFRQWASSVFQTALDVFCIADDVNINEMMHALKQDTDWNSDKAKLVEFDKEEFDLCEEFSKISHKNVQLCKLKSRSSLHPADEDNRMTKLFVMEADGSDIDYYPGDHIAIYPRNRPHLVAGILKRLQKTCPKPDQVYQVQIKTYQQTFEGMKTVWKPMTRMPACSMRTALTKFLDITTPPAQKLLGILAQYCEAEEDKLKLTELSKDIHMYEAWKEFYFPNLLEVLELLPSCQPDPALFLIHLPQLQPRFYSISSSPVACPGEIHLTVAIVVFKNQDGKGNTHYGVCSNFLADCKEGDVFPTFIRSAPTFQMPDDPKTPVIMVGPGTGIAPFRSFWQHRTTEKKRSPSTMEFGQMTLFFGCRTPKVELYKWETQTMLQKGVLANYYVAFSRERHKPKLYVQDIIRDEVAEEVCHEIVQQEGHFYVCGDVMMAHDVNKALSTVLHQFGNMTIEEADKYIATMREHNRYHEDIFGITLRTAEQTRKVRKEATQKLKSSQSNSSLLDNDESAEQ